MEDQNYNTLPPESSSNSPQWELKQHQSKDVELQTLQKSTAEKDNVDSRKENIKTNTTQFKPPSTQDARYTPTTDSSIVTNSKHSQPKDTQNMISGSKRLLVLFFVLLCLLLNFICFVSNKLLFVRVANNDESLTGCFVLLLVPLVPTMLSSFCQWMVLEKYTKDDPTWRFRHGILVVVALIFGIIEGLLNVCLIWVLFEVKNPLLGVSATYLTTVIPCFFVTLSYCFRLRGLNERRETNKQKVKGIRHGVKVVVLLFASLLCTAAGYCGLVWFYSYINLTGYKLVLSVFAFIPLTVAPNMMYKGLEVLQAPFWDGWNRHRYGLGLMKSIAKLVTIVIAMTVVEGWTLDLMDAFDHRQPNLWMIITGFVSYFVTFVSCRAGYQLTGLFIPMALSPLFCGLMVYQPQYCDSLVGIFGVDSCGFSSNATDYQFILLLVSSVPYWFLIFNLARKGMWVPLPDEKSMFWQNDIQVANNDVGTLLNRDRKRQLKEENQFHKHVFVTVTMWHEEKEEVTTSVKALVDLMQYRIDKCDFECHFFIDSAFEQNEMGEWKPNQYVKGLRNVIRDFGLIRRQAKQRTWFGLAEKWEMPDDPTVSITINCKNQRELRGKKRWSQIVYLAEFFKRIAREQRGVLKQPKIEKKKTKSGFFSRCFGEVEDDEDNDAKTWRPEHTYILMLDCDTRFEPHAVEVLVDSLASQTDRVGAVCGRIIPEGDELPNPIVWFQEFEYAVSHWLNKSCEDIFGSVLCCPGAFSMVHMRALQYKVTDAVTKNPLDNPPSVPETCAAGLYCKKVASGMDVLKYDQGEDRLLCTFLIKNGWKLSYNSNAIAYTHCPTTFSVFFNQRRRWIVSTMANLCYLLSIAPEILSCNRSISSPFIAYIFINLISAVLTPATVMLLFASGFVYAFKCTVAWSVVLSLGIPILYLFICMYYAYDPTRDAPTLKAPKINVQVNTAFHISLILAVIMLIALIGIAGSVAENPLRVDSMYFICLCVIFIFTSFIYKEGWILLYGIVFLFLLPTMYLILFMYAMNNMQDQGWGTREGNSEKDSKLKHPFSVLWKKVHSAGTKHFPRIFSKESAALPEQQPKPENDASAQKKDSKSEAPKIPLPPDVTAANCELVIKLIGAKFSAMANRRNLAVVFSTKMNAVKKEISRSSALNTKSEIDGFSYTKEVYWNETLNVALKDRKDTIMIDIVAGEAVLGSTEISTAMLRHGEEQFLQAEFSDGKLEFAATLLMNEKSYLTEHPQGFKRPFSLPKKQDKYEAVVKLIRATNLLPTRESTCGPFVCIWTKNGSIAKGKLKSRPSQNNRGDPVWAENFIVPLKDKHTDNPQKKVQRDAILLQIYDKEALDDKHLGFVKIPVTHLIHQKEVTLKLPLKVSKSTEPKAQPSINAHLHVAITLIDPEANKVERREKGFEAGTLQRFLKDSVLLRSSNQEEEKKTAQKIAKDLIGHRYTVGLMLIAVTFCWFVMGLVLTAHPGLNILSVNAPGLLFVMAFGLLLFLQFIGMLFDILGCFLQDLALTKGIFTNGDSTSFFFVGKNPYSKLSDEERAELFQSSSTYPTDSLGRIGMLLQRSGSTELVEVKPEDRTSEIGLTKMTSSKFSSLM